MIARADPVDQYLAQHPERLFQAPRERIGVDLDNLVILSEQLKCASFELPFRSGADGEVPGFGSSPHVAPILDYLASECGLLLQREEPGEPGGIGGGWYWVADSYPAQDV